MEHLRMIVPAALRADVDAALDSPDVANIVVLPGAGIRPPGDVILCDVRRPAAGRLLRLLDQIGVDDIGSIAVENVDLSMDPIGREDPARLFGGSDDDAVVLQEVESRTEAEVHLTATYLVFMAVATAIGAIGVVLDQPVFIIAAMVVGPDFGPLAAVSVGLVRRNRLVVGRSLLAILVGFTTGILFAYLLSLVLLSTGVFPSEVFAGENEPLTAFIWQPNVLGAIIGVLGGIAGMLSLTSAKSGALVGVLIAVTTVTASSAVAVGIAYGEWDEAAGAAVNLLVNLASIVIGACGTLLFQVTMLGRRVRSWGRPRAR